MSVIPDLLPVPDNTSSIGLDQLVLPNPVTGTQYQPASANNEQDFWNSYTATPASFNSQLSPERFDWDKSNTDRYAQSDSLKDVGFDPMVGVQNIDGKPYDINELRYGSVQTWGDVIGNAGAGAFYLGVGSFKESVKSWGNTFDALFTWGTGGSAREIKEAFMGSPDELLAENQKQEAIMNKYAIYNTPESDNTLFNKKFTGDLIEQMGFGAGMAAEIIGETLLTGAIGRAFRVFSAGIKGAEVIQAERTLGTVAPRLAAVGEEINDLRRASDISGNRQIMQSVWEGAKNLIPGAEIIGDMRAAAKAGETGYNIFKAGVPGTIKLFSMANAAKAEAMMEAAGTYGQLYGDLSAKFEQEHGHTPTGEELDRIRESAYGAATDNFIVNTGLLMTMNQLEFGSMFSKFGSAKRLLREAVEDTEGIFTIAGKLRNGTKGRVAYQAAAGPFSGLRNANAIRKDFGFGTALWQGAKRWGVSQGAKFEVAEGVQELLQNSSDAAFREYYKNLYDGSRDINGVSFFDALGAADFGKAIHDQNIAPTDAESRRALWQSSGGWKTFIMGATTGMLMSPLSSAAMYANRKGYAMVNKDYKDQLTKKQDMIVQNTAILNGFYQDPYKLLNDHIANVKVQGTTADNMAGTTDRYTFINNREDAFAKAVATAIKTGNYESFLDHIKEFGDKFQTDKEFEAAFPNLKSTGMEATDMREFLDTVTNDITQYYTNWQNLKDEYGSSIDISTKEGMFRKRVLDDAIETLATTSHLATAAIKRVGDIKTQMAALPTIGLSVNKGFDILGDTRQVDIQMAILIDQIKVYESLGTTKDSTGRDIAEQLKIARKQLQHLQQWKSTQDEFNGTTAPEESDEQDMRLIYADRMRQVYKDYIDATNQEFGVDTIVSKKDIDDSFQGLIDYIALNKDHRDYIQALNVLSDTKNFKTLNERLLDAAYWYQTHATQQMKEEIRERAAAETDVEDTTTGTEEDIPDEEESTDDGAPVTKLGTEAIRADILRYYSEQPAAPGSSEGSWVLRKDMHPDSAKYLAKYPKLAGTLDTLEDQRRDGMNEAIYQSQVKEVINKHFDDIAGEVNKEADKKHQRELWYKELEAVRKKYSNTGSDPLSTEDMATRIALEAEINSRYKKLLGIEETAPELPEEIDLPKMKILHSQVAIAPHREPGMNNAQAAERLTAILKPLSSYQLQHGLSLVVTRNSTVAPDRTDIQGNSNIISKGQQYSLQLLHNGVPLGYLTNADSYIFNVDGEQLTAQQIDSSNIDKILDIPSYMTTTSAAALFKADAETAANIQVAIESRLGNNDTATIEGDDLLSILSVYTEVSMDYTDSTDGTRAPLFSELQDISYDVPVGDLSRMVVYNNRVEYTPGGEPIEEMILGRLDDLNYLPPLPQNDNRGMYSAAIQVGGKVKWIQLTPTLYDEQQMQATLDRITELTSLPERTEADIKEIQELLGGIFIAQPVYTRESGSKEVDTEKKVKLTLLYNSTKNTVLVSTGEKNKAPLTLGTSVFSTPQQLADKVTKVVQKRHAAISVSPENFRHQVPLDSDYKTRVASVMGMTASVRANVVNSIALSYTNPVAIQTKEPSSNIYQKSVPTISSGSVTELPQYQERLDELRKAAEDNDIEQLKKLRKKKSKEDIQKVTGTEPFTEQSVEAIDRFRVWVQNNLPDFISVEDMGVLLNNLEQQHITVGQFLTHLNGLGGTIQVYKNSPYKYHEAFHAVFRLLLPQDKIDQLFSIARKEYSITDSKVQQFLVERPQYKGMGKTFIEERILEEYMADKFDKWKMDRKTPTSHIIKGFFASILDWFRNIWNKLTGSQIEGLFYDINKGRYKKAELQVNQFTDVHEGISEPVDKIISVGVKDIVTASGKVIEVEQFLPQTTADQLSSSIAALYHQNVKNLSQHNKGQELDKILDIYRNTYNTSLPFYKEQASAITDIGKRLAWWNKLIDLETVFTDTDSRNSLKEAVDLHLQIMGYKQSMDDDTIEDIEEEVGSRNVDTVYKKQGALSDYGSLSKFLRSYIGSTTYTIDKDEFGNRFFRTEEGEYDKGNPLVSCVNANKVYNGLLKTLSNRANESQLLDKMIDYITHSGNPETTQFINRVFEETDFDFETKTPRKDSILLQQVIKGFNQYETNYLFTRVEGTSYTTSYANTQNAARNQFSLWYDQHKSLKKIGTDALSRLADNLDVTASGDRITNSRLATLCDSISTALQKQIGIALHPTYLKYSIIANKEEDKRTADQQAFYDMYSDNSPIEVALLRANLIEPIRKGQDIFIKNSDSTGTEQFLLKIASANANFDESVNTMSFTNADNEIVYGHNLPNYDFVRVKELNNMNILNGLLQSVDHNTWILSDPKFLYLAEQNKLSVEQVDGIRADDNKGVTYSAYNRREYLANLLGLYDIRKQPDAQVRVGKDIWYRTPIATRVIESKSNIHLVRMPVIKAVTKNGLSKEATDIMYLWIQNEVNRIARVRTEIADIAAGTYTGKVIEGYHTSAKGKEPRGLHLFNTALMVGDMATDIEQGILDEQAIRDQLNRYWKQQAIELAGMMQDNGLIRDMKVTDGVVQATNVLAPSYLFQGFKNDDINKAMGTTTQFHNNLMQVLINDLINTTEINKLLLGDEAKSFSDPIDQVKRMAGANATGPSMNIAFTAPDMGIEHTLPNIHHVTYKTTKVLSSVSGKGIDSDDGQMYGTAKTLRYILFGFGKLNKTQADIITKLSEGGSVTTDEFFGAGGLKDSGPFNSYKLVYFDGSTYLKCSFLPLFREAVSIEVDGEWEPIAGKEDAHNLLNTLEGYESRNNTVVFAHPVSVSKGLKQNIASSLQDIDDSHFNQLESRYMRQQLENPSNKLVITDPTQAKQQIMSEQVDSTPVMFMGHTTTVGAVKRAYMLDVSHRETNNYQNAANSIFDLDGALIELGKSIDIGSLTPRMADFFDHMKETMQATGSDQQTLGFLETRDEQPLYNLNFPSTLEKFTQIFLNYFSKGVLAEKVPGQSLALVSGALGMGTRVKRVISLNDNGQPRQWEVIPMAEYKRNPSRYSSAKRWDSKDTRIFSGLQVGDYYIDDLRHNVPEYDSQGNIIGRFSEYLAPAHYREEMGGAIESLQKGFGIRIPSDDKHSYIALRKVDVLPVQYGSIGIFPHELIEIAGSDFDIDKEYVSIPDTYVKEGKRLAYGTATTPDAQYDEYVQWQMDNNKFLQRAVKDFLATDSDIKELVSSLKLSDARQSELTQQIIDNNRFLTDPEGSDRLFRTTKKDLLQAHKEGRLEAAEVLDLLQGTTSFFIKGQMARLGLPSTLQEFMDKGGADILNNGVINNRVLQARITMLNNEHIASGISSTPTSTDPLLQLVSKLQSDFQAIADDESVTNKKGISAILGILQESTTDVNSLIGKVSSYGANMEGARNIGAAANGVQGYSLLNQYSVPIEQEYRITIDGHTYTGFGNSREYASIAATEVYYEKGKNKGQLKGYIVAGQLFSIKDFEKGYVPTGDYTGTRIFSNLSTLLNAMTDNAKERLAARLGLNITALGYVATMVSQGIPMETSILLMLQPSVRSYFKQLSALDGTLKTEEESVQSKGLLLSQLIGPVRLGTADEITTQDLIDDIITGTNSQRSLELLELVDQQSKVIRNISRIQKLSQGLPSTWEDIDRINTALLELGIEYSDKGYQAIGGDTNLQGLIDLPIDVRSVLLHDQQIIATNLKILGQVQQLAKKVFLEKTPIFGRMTDIVLANMKVRNVDMAAFSKTLKMDLISYLSMKALKNSGEVTQLQTLDNALIYPQLQQQMAPEFRNIVQIVQGLKEKLGDNRNYLISNFLMLTEAEKSATNINTVESNTWAKLSDLQQDKLVTSFVDLYTNAYSDDMGNEIQTHEDAIAMFNYLLVKDGGQFKSGSFIRFMPNFMFKDIMDKTAEVNDLLSLGWNEEVGYNLFGVPSQDILNGFMDGYSTHIGNKEFIIPIQKSSITANNPMEVTAQSIKVNIFKGLSYKKVYSDQEQETIAYNRLLIAGAGFSMADGEVVFPLSVKVDDILYTLKGVGSDQNAPIATNLIPTGTTVATGYNAEYIAAEWRGAGNTFKASSVLGQLPVSTNNSPQGPEGTDMDTYTSQQGTVPAAAGTFSDQLQQMGVVFSVRNGKKVAIKDGVEYALPDGPATIDVIRNVIDSVRNIEGNSVSSGDMENIQFREHPLADYPSRTKINASSDATLALAVDFSSAGEKLTKNSVTAQGKKYIPIDLNKELVVTPERVSKVVQMLNESAGNDLFGKKAISLNIAGNGIYTMKGIYTQDQLDEFTYQLLLAVTQSPALQITIASINTGGQTGMDEAGAKAGQRLGIPTTVLAPKGYKFRNISGQDISSEQQFKSRFSIAGTSDVSLTPAQWKQQLTDIYGSKERAEAMVPWMKEQIAFRDRAQSLGASDSDILNSIKCL